MGMGMGVIIIFEIIIVGMSTVMDFDGVMGIVMIITNIVVMGNFMGNVMILTMISISISISVSNKVSGALIIIIVDFRGVINIVSRRIPRPAQIDSPDDARHERRDLGRTSAFESRVFF